MNRIDSEPGRARGARGAIVTMLALGALLAPATPAAARPLFGPAGAAEVPTERLFDIGVADYDGDGLLDMFTANHKFHSAFLHNDGGGTFTDSTAATGLSPTPAFPGYEDLREPVRSAPGIYVYATDSKSEKLPGLVHIATVGVETSGSISFGADSLTIPRSENAQTTQGMTGSGQPLVKFQLAPGAALDIRPSHIDLPAVVSFDAPTAGGLLPPPLGPPAPPPPPVYVGTDAVPAPLDFVLNLRDRHGYAFADLAGDPGTDVFAITGGLGGVIKLPGYAGKVQDELLVQRGGRFADSTPGAGLSKGTCRGRESATVDIDGNGLLDLFESCEGDPPNVYLQVSRGQFNSIAPPPSIATTYRWVTLRSGSHPQLLAAQPGGTRVWSVGSQGWRLRQSVQDDARNGEVAQYALNDYDNDGDLDVLAVARSGNTLFENDRGQLSSVPLKRTGIPDASVAASFVDFDNDGRVDLDLVPQGLLRGVGKGRFRETGRLRTGIAGAGITNWFDYDNDGLRDPVIATGNAEFAKRMKVTRARNLGPGGHWLEVDLRGEAGNREAIGARVTLKAGNRPLYQWVGQNEDSHHSQGHYRLYFGLGKHEQAGRVVVRWPDGVETRLGTFLADRVIEVSHP